MGNLKAHKLITADIAEIFVEKIAMDMKSMSVDDLSQSLKSLSEIHYAKRSLESKFPLWRVQLEEKFSEAM